IPQNAPYHAPVQVWSPRWRVFGFFLPTGQVTIAASSSCNKCSFCRPSAIASALSAPSGVSNFRTTSDDAIRILHVSVATARWRPHRAAEARSGARHFLRAFGTNGVCPCLLAPWIPHGGPVCLGEQAGAQAQSWWSISLFPNALSLSNSYLQRRIRAASLDPRR